MTEGAAIEWKKEIKRKATSQEILEHLRTIAKEKGLVKGAKVKGIQSNSELLLHTIVQEDDDYYPESDEYAKSGIILYSNGKWAEKVEEVKDYEILSYKYNNNIYNFTLTPCLIGTIRYRHYECDGGTIDEGSMYQLSIKPTIHSVKCLKSGNVYTIGDKVEYQNTPYNLNNIVLKNNALQIDLNGICVMLSLTDIKTYKPKFTFGGYEVKCELFNGTRVKVVCKGEVGYHTEIEEILKNYFRPCKFGNVEVKSFSFKTWSSPLKREVIKQFNDLNEIDKVEIGCITGTYKELYDIYQHCLTLLK